MWCTYGRMVHALLSVWYLSTSPVHESEARPPNTRMHPSPPSVGSPTALCPCSASVGTSPGQGQNAWKSVGGSEAGRFSYYEW